MPIRDLLDADAFAPEAINSMSGAMADVLAALESKDKPDDLKIDEWDAVALTSLSRSRRMRAFRASSNTRPRAGLFHT